MVRHQHLVVVLANEQSQRCMFYVQFLDLESKT